MIAEAGRVLFVAGLLGVLGAQVYACVRIVRASAVSAVLALMVPGYVLYYVWRSPYRMPRLVRLWCGCAVAMLTGLWLITVVS